jgi:hypothetical protein
MACVKKAAQRIKGLCTCIRTDRMQYMREGRPTEPTIGSFGRIYASDSVLMNTGPGVCRTCAERAALQQSVMLTFETRPR